MRVGGRVGGWVGGWACGSVDGCLWVDGWVRVGRWAGCALEGQLAMLKLCEWVSCICPHPPHTPACPCLPLPAPAPSWHCLPACLPAPAAYQVYSQPFLNFVEHHVSMWSWWPASFKVGRLGWGRLFRGAVGWSGRRRAPPPVPALPLLPCIIMWHTAATGTPHRRCRAA